MNAEYLRVGSFNTLKVTMMNYHKWIYMKSGFSADGYQTKAVGDIREPSIGGRGMTAKRYPEPTLATLCDRLSEQNTCEGKVKTTHTRTIVNQSHLQYSR